MKHCLKAVELNDTLLHFRDHNSSCIVVARNAAWSVIGPRCGGERPSLRGGGDGASFPGKRCARAPPSLRSTLTPSNSQHFESGCEMSPSASPSQSVIPPLLLLPCSLSDCCHRSRRRRLGGLCSAVLQFNYHLSSAQYPPPQRSASADFEAGPGGVLVERESPRRSEFWQILAAVSFRI